MVSARSPTDGSAIAFIPSDSMSGYPAIASHIHLPMRTRVWISLGTSCSSLSIVSVDDGMRSSYRSMTAS